MCIDSFGNERYFSVSNYVKRATTELDNSRCQRSLTSPPDSPVLLLHLIALYYFYTWLFFGAVGPHSRFR